MAYKVLRWSCVLRAIVCVMGAMRDQLHQDPDLEEDVERPIPKERPPDQVAREALEGGPGALSPVRSLYAHEQRVREREGRDASKPRATTTATTQPGEGEAGGR